MNQTWWRNADDVDEDQARIFALPLGGRHLIVGPPGSGKTNVLLLRAIYLMRAGRPNLRLMSFGRSLIEFVRSGVRQNGLMDEGKIQTVAQWQIQLMYSLSGKQFRYSGDDFAVQRRERCEQLQTEILRSGVGRNYYDALLLDEAQDLTRAEVELISSLASELYFVGDSRQRIYNENEGLETIRQIVDSEHALRWHYRIGRKICQAADRLLPNDDSLSQYCQYDEVALPSSVGLHQYPSRRDQLRAIVERIDTQLRAYPGEWIGVIAPRNILLEEFEDYIAGGPLADLTAVHRQGSREFDAERPIVAMTAHSAKGTEFRAVHIFSAESFAYFRREIGFTVITRAKTSVDCYFTGSIDGALEAAFSTERLPHPSEVFP